MAISLAKKSLVDSDIFDLDEDCKMLKVQLLWQANEEENGFDFDLDLEAFLLDENGKVTKEEDAIYYNGGNADISYGNIIRHSSGSITHLGDNRKGGGFGETIQLDLTRVPKSIEQVDFTVTVYDASERGQNFGMVSEARLSVVDLNGNKEIFDYNLTRDYKDYADVFIGSFLRTANGWWSFKANGEGHTGGLEQFLHCYGVDK